jgi:hypothetical protein
MSSTKKNLLPSFIRDGRGSQQGENFSHFELDTSPHEFREVGARKDMRFHRYFGVFGLVKGRQTDSTPKDNERFDIIKARAQQNCVRQHRSKFIVSNSFAKCALPLTNGKLT